MSSPYGDSRARSAEHQAAPHARAREAAYARVNAQLRAAPRVARLGAHATGEDWALELPRDKVAAAEYLRGIERARTIELDSIRTLRRNIEGDRLGTVRRLGRRGIVVLLVAIVIGSGVWWWQGRSSPDTRNVRAVGAASTDHTAHQSMGSGVAVELSESKLGTSRNLGEPGITTFILRNIGTKAREFVIVPRPRIRGNAASMTPAELHAAAVAANHELKPGSREELAVELAAGEYVLISSTAGSDVRTSPFRVG